MIKRALWLCVMLASLPALGAPVITNFLVVNTTSNTATMTWTTDEASTSQLQWGTDPSLPYANNANPVLVTSHSMTLPLLQPGPLYYVAAVSKDASGQITQSASITFSLCGNGYTQVSGSINNYYQYGSYALTWVPPSGTAQSPTICGLPVATSVAGSLDGGASFNTQVADASKIVPGPGQWKVQATDAGNLAPLTIYAYLSQQSQNVSEQLQTAASVAGLAACITNTNTSTTYPSTCGSGGGGGGSPTGPAGGVLSGTYPNPGLNTSGVTLPNGSTATTQTAGDNTSAIATDAFVKASPATNLAGGALGSVPYQSGPNVTSFVASPTTTGTYFLGWTTSGSAVNPIAQNLATYLSAPPAIGGVAPASGTFTTVNDKIHNGVSICKNYPGSTVDQQVNACLADAIAQINGNTSGLADASGLGGGSFTTTAQITVGNSSGVGVKLILPCNGKWYGSMTDGTSDTLKQYGGSSIEGCPASGLAAQFVITATAGSNLRAVYEAVTATNPYIYAKGFNVNNTGGHITATGVGLFFNGPMNDGSTFDAVNVNDSLDTYCAEAYNVSAATTWKHSAINCQNHGTPFFSLTDSGGYVQSMTLTDMTITHAGTGLPEIRCDDTRAATPHISFLNLDQIYTETGTDGTTTQLQDNGCGAISVNDWIIKSQSSGSTAPGITVSNAYNTNLSIKNMIFRQGSGTFTYPINAVVNNYTSQTLQTDSSGNFGLYEPPGVPNFLGTLGVGAMTLTGVTGSTQCLQVNSVGLISGTGGSCGGSAITALTGDVTASGSGSVAATVKGINGTIVSGLASGLLYNTTTTGVPSIATSPQVVTALNASPSTTLAPALLPLATGSAFGAIRPDGVSCTVSAGILACTGSGGGITTLTGDVTASGSGSVAATVKGINGTIVSSLASGILYNTTTTGVPSIATSPQLVTALNNSPSTTLAVALLPLGTSSTAGALQCGSGTTCSGGVITVSGGGSGNLTGSLTSGYLPVASGATTLVNSLAQDNGTTFSYGGSGGYTSTAGTAGRLTLSAGTGTAPALPANSAGWHAPTTGGTSYTYTPPSTWTQGVMYAGAPTAGSDGTLQALVTAFHPQWTVGATGNWPFFPAPEVVYQATSLNAAQFIKLTVTNTAGGTCTTAPTFNIFSGTSTGTSLVGSTTQQALGTASAVSESLAVPAGVVYGVYMSNQGSSCTGAVYSVVATVEEQ